MRRAREVVLNAAIWYGQWNPYEQDPSRTAGRSVYQALVDGD